MNDCTPSRSRSAVTSASEMPSPVSYTHLDVYKRQQEAIDRWWWPALMMFGPHDSESSNTPQLVRWGIKTKSNDQLRQEFIDEMVPALHALGLSVPDPEMCYDAAAGHWTGREIDWDEFWRVIKGDGPMNADRLAARRQAHEDGRWVREAASAYAAKMTSV